MSTTFMVKGGKGMTDKNPSTEQMLLERLDRMEEQLQTLVKAQQGLAELKSRYLPPAELGRQNRHR